MRVVEIDERDASWEKDENTFRVFITNSDASVSVYDCVSGDFYDVARWASSQSNRFRIALIGEDRSRRRGLFWLTASDDMRRLQRLIPCDA